MFSVCSSNEFYHSKVSDFEDTDYQFQVQLDLIEFHIVCKIYVLFSIHSQWIPINVFKNLSRTLALRVLTFEFLRWCLCFNTHGALQIRESGFWVRCTIPARHKISCSQSIPQMRWRSKLPSSQHNTAHRVKAFIVLTLSKSFLVIRHFVHVGPLTYTHVSLLHY